MIPLGHIDNKHMQDRKNGTKSQGIITLIEINTLFLVFHLQIMLALSILYLGVLKKFFQLQGALFFLYMDEKI